MMNGRRIVMFGYVSLILVVIVFTILASRISLRKQSKIVRLHGKQLTDYVQNRRFVYFDLGVNNGDSLLSFFNMKNGGIVGGDLSYATLGPQAASARWIVYGFEANPHFTNYLHLIEAILSHKHTVNMYTDTAAWTYDGTIDFYLDTVNKKSDFWGSSLERGHPDVLQSGSRHVTIKCKDIAALIKQYTENDFVVVKIDIEGSEYELILDLIKKDALRYIDLLAVEYHPNVANIHTAPDLFQNIFKKYNIAFSEWN